MTPTMGRIVHYVEVVESGEVLSPAIIHHVHNDTCVDLHVFRKWGGASYVTSALLTSPGMGATGWFWPPRVEAP